MTCLKFQFVYKHCLYLIFKHCKGCFDNIKVAYLSIVAVSFQNLFKFCGEVKTSTAKQYI